MVASRVSAWFRPVIATDLRRAAWILQVYAAAGCLWNINRATWSPRWTISTRWPRAPGPTAYT